MSFAKESPLTINEALRNILEAQEGKFSGYPTYEIALNEIKTGGKRSHWIWYIFPTVYKVRSSSFWNKFDLPNFKAVEEYLKHPILCHRLIEIFKIAIEQLKKRIPKTRLFMSDVDVEKVIITASCFLLVSKRLGLENSKIFENFLKLMNENISKKAIEEFKKEYKLSGGSYFIKYLKYKKKYLKLKKLFI